MVKVSRSVSTTEFTSFDIIGRVTASKQTTDGVTYGNGSTDSPMTYTYNLSGALIERVVKNVLAANGDLSIVESKKNANSGYWHYADSPTYNAAGALTSLQLGNGLGIDRFQFTPATDADRSRNCPERLRHVEAEL